MKLFDVVSGKCKATLTTQQGFNPEGVLAMAFTPDGKTLVSVGSPNEIKCWDAATGKNTATQNTADELGYTAAAAFTSDAKTVATQISDSVKLWDVATGKENAVFKIRNTYVQCLAFSPNDKLLASGDEKGTIRFWDVAKGKEIAAIKAHAETVKCLAFTPDGSILASGGKDTMIKLWDVPKEKQ